MSGRFGSEYADWQVKQAEAALRLYDYGQKMGLGLEISFFNQSLLEHLTDR